MDIIEPLDLDTVEALGLDGTGRSVSDGRWPYTLGTLNLDELLLLTFLGDEATHFPDEAQAPETALWYEDSQQELRRRLGDDALENLAQYCVEYHASVQDLIQSARGDVTSVLAIMRTAA